MTRELKIKLRKDIIILLLNFIPAIILYKSGILDYVTNIGERWVLLGIFFAGVGFASAFSALPSTAALFVFAQHVPFLQVALVGAAGSAVGDIGLFLLLRRGIGEDARILLDGYTEIHKVPIFFKSRLFHWLLSFIAVLIIILPIPDEIGLTILSVMRLKTKKFFLVAFAFNFIGILIITLIAQGT